MEKSESDTTVTNDSQLAKLAQYTANKSRSVVNINTYPRSEREFIQVNPFPDAEQKAKLKKIHEGKGKASWTGGAKKRSIEVQIADMDTEIVDPASVLVPTGDDSDTDWTTVSKPN